MSLSNFGNLMYSAMAYNWEHREPRDKCSNPTQYAVEHCTVHLNLGRFTGKSDFIRNHMDHDFVGECAVILHSSRERGSSRWKDCPRVYSVNELKNYPFAMQSKFHNIKTYFIDEPGLVFKEMSEYDLYNFMGDSERKQIFVKLGS